MIAHDSELKPISNTKTHRTLMVQQSDESTQTTQRLIAYVYPERHPRYMALYTKFPPDENQAALKILVAVGWKSAKRELDGRWVMSETSGRSSFVDLPIPDLRLSSHPKGRYNLYLKTSNPEHAPIIQYYNSLPSMTPRAVARPISCQLAARSVHRAF